MRRIAIEAAELGVSEIFVTGGEPFMLADIGDILAACAAAAPTTVLTNGMLFAGRRLETLRSLPRERVTLQISLDSPTPERHDRHRGKGTWARAWKGIERARAEGFRVRLAATVSNDDGGRGIPRLPRRASDQRGGSGDPAHCAARLRHAGHRAGARGSGARSDDHGGRRVIGIRSEPRMPICWSAAKFFRSPIPSPRCAAPSIANSEHQRRLAMIFNCA